MRNHWTAERNEELKRHEATGLSASKSANVASRQRSAGIGRSNMG
jgi:hypothetical protein